MTKKAEFGLTHSVNFENVSTDLSCVTACVLCLTRNGGVESEGPNESLKEWEHCVLPKWLMVCSVDTDASWDSSAANCLRNQVTEQYRCNHTSSYILDCTTGIMCNN